MVEPSFKKSFGFAVLLHLIIFFLLVFEMEPKSATVSLSKNVQKSIEIEEENKPVNKLPDKVVINAVSLNNEEVMQAVNHLKQEKEKQLKLEAAKQKALQEQAAAAKRHRIQEQQRIAQLKREEEALALRRQKKIEEEQRHLRQLAQEKAQEAKRLEALKVEQENLRKKHQEEAQKLLQLQKQQAEEKNLEEQRKAAAALAEKNRIAAERAAKMSGEVNKYKALIISAISRQWILPDNANDNLSSKFRIRLAPDGAVLDVKLIRSSGDIVLDRSAQSAIYKASPLPVPNNPEVFELFRDISLTVRPENVRG